MSSIILSAVIVSGLLVGTKILGRAYLPKIPWWVKITTGLPSCVYYFGPFHSHQEAKENQGGYLSDLIEEGAFKITVEIIQDNPVELTIFEASEDREFS